MKEEFPFAADPKTRVDGNPYINSNSFRCISNWRLDFTDEPIDPDKVERGDIIYLNSLLLVPFFTLVDPSIKVPYILLVHDSDISNDVPELPSSNIVVMGVVNSLVNTHPKVIPLPLGIPNGVALGYAQKEDYIEASRLNIEKTIFCSSNFRDFCHSRRTYANTVLADKDYITKLPSSSVEKYVYNLASSIFCVSPRGAGLDCYRNWEALLFDCIPIVETSALNSLFYKLPILIVDDFSNLTENKLIDFYNFVRANKCDFLIEKIYMKYWSDFFLRLQTLIRENLEYEDFIKEFKRNSFGI